MILQQEKPKEKNVKFHRIDVIVKVQSEYKSRKLCRYRNKKTDSEQDTKILWKMFESPALFLIEAKQACKQAHFACISHDIIAYISGTVHMNEIRTRIGLCFIHICSLTWPYQSLSLPSLFTLHWRQSKGTDVT